MSSISIRAQSHSVTPLPQSSATATSPHLTSRPVAQALAAIGLCLPLGAWAADIVVNSALDTTGDGAICTLRDAILSANSDAAIGGCVAGSGADNITFALAGATVIPLQTPLPTIARALSIDGGAGIVIERSPTANTVSNFRMLDVNGVSSGPFPFSLSNATLRDGYTSVYQNGAGLRANTLSSVTLTNVTLGGSKPNLSGGNGGGAFVYKISGDVSLNYVTVQGNQADQRGGGLDLDNVSGNVTIFESSFGGNTATSDRGGSAYLGYVDGATRITRSEFVGNRALNIGAAISAYGNKGSIEIESTYVGSNSVQYDPDAGTSNRYSIVDVEASNVVSVMQSWMESSGPEGGPYDPTNLRVFDSPAVSVIDSTINPGPGLALFTNAAEVLIENSTVSDRTPSNAYATVGLYAAEGPVTARVRNSTITGNARVAVSGVAPDLDIFSGTPVLIVDNSIISGNGLDVRGGINVVANFSLLGTGVAVQSGSNNIFSNTPGLSALSAAYNPNRTAGPTANARPIPVHRPLLNSLALDAGDPGFAAPPNQDQTGAARVRASGSSGGTPRLDIGAVEAFFPRVTISNGSALEGTATSNNVVFTVALSAVPDPGADITVDFLTHDDTAIAGSDYVARSGTMTFSRASNTLSQLITVPTIPDTTVEPDETFGLSLNNVSNAILSSGGNAVSQLLVVGSIINDDTALLTISNASTVEGGNALFTVSLSAPVSNTVSVGYVTSGDTATSGTDFVPSSGTLTFAPGETSKTFVVPTIDDALVEPTETFVATLTVNAAPAGVSFGAGSGVAIGTIIDNDVANLSVGNASTVEGGNAVFTVTLSNPSTNAVSVMYATAGGSATSGADFAPSSGMLTFAPGETSKVVAVSTVDDLYVESTETFTLNLSNAVSATIVTATGIGTIIDNDTSNAITVTTVIPGIGSAITTYESASNCVVTLGVQGVVGLSAGTLVLPNPIAPPLGYVMPYGMQQVELFTCPGGSVSITATWPGAFSSHWKWGATGDQPAPHWYLIATAPTGVNTVKFTVTDGAFGDNDRTVDGRIIDPYAAAVAAEVKPVPVAGGWMAWLVALLLSLAGAVGLRRGNSKNCK